MNTVEFKTKSKNGMIKIPGKYKELNSEKLTVIIIPEKGDQKNVRLNKFLKFVKQMKINLPKNYRFERDKLYER